MIGIAMETTSMYLRLCWVVGKGLWSAGLTAWRTASQLNKSYGIYQRENQEDRMSTRYGSRRLGLPTPSHVEHRYSSALEPAAPMKRKGRTATVVVTLAAYIMLWMVGVFTVETFTAAIEIHLGVIMAAIYGLYASRGAAKQERMIESTRQDLMQAVVQVINENRGTKAQPMLKDLPPLMPEKEVFETSFPGVPVPSASVPEFETAPAPNVVPGFSESEPTGPEPDVDEPDQSEVEVSSDPAVNDDDAPGPEVGAEGWGGLRGFWWDPAPRVALPDYT